MKLALLAATLMLGSAAIAQAQDSSMSTTTTSTTTTTPGTTVAPSNAAPERDARGIAVISDAATAPPGWNSMPAVGGTGASPSAPAQPEGSAGPLPPCSKKVTDHCTQTYERGVPKQG
jgi:hypothetical protein